ncbi:uncharacterized protein TM35_000381300 [Trypanosoma theileri]|uniref:DUF4139 domain-containing protein n=1 Tax=Trypanosoma theileri TaxID=67003 RepID=A0A1X0NJZ5_9TRYP|nr:uncharacterized protein TM35_000381300 [Trypanosoma theileri]ORC85055.1 hypothetical protein TM35_000381300 [Trypanosoma theileri]
MAQTERNNVNEPITIRTESKADEVTVYQQRAQVRRYAKVELPATINNAGEEEELLLYFAMPEEFDRDSVQVYFDEHTAEHVVLRATLFEENEDEVEDAEGKAAAADYASHLQNIRNELREVEKQLALNQLDLTAVKEEATLNTNLFTRLCGPVTDGLPTSLDVEYWESQLTGVEKRVRDNCAERRRLEKKDAELRKTQQHLREKQRELQQGNNNNNNDIKPLNTTSTNSSSSRSLHQRRRRNWACLVLRVRSALSAASVFVTYATTNTTAAAAAAVIQNYCGGPQKTSPHNSNNNNVGWHGEYTASLDPRRRRVTLRYTAVVRAAVEPLADVAVTLSSASHRGGKNGGGQPGDEDEGVPPSLNSAWRLEAVRNPEGRGRGIEEEEEASSEDEEDVRRRHVMWGQSLTGEGGRNDATLTASAIVNVTLPSRYTFPTDGAPLRVPLAVLEWDADIAYSTVPDMVEAVFAHATCVNKSSYLLMPGKMAVFMDGDFVANAEIERTAPGEELHLDFGVDNTIEVERKLLHRLKTVDKASLFTRERKQRILYSYSTVLTNKKQDQEGSSGAVTVTLSERIPKSNEEKLVVRLIEPKDHLTGKGQESEKRQRELEVDGKVEMKINILPGETVTVPFSFEVEAPHDATIFGL